MCNCKLTEIVLGVIILLFAVWDWGIDPRFSKWIVGIAAVLLILHASMCKSCGMPVSSRRKK